MRKRPLTFIIICMVLGILFNQINGIILMVISFLFILLFTNSGNKQKIFIWMIVALIFGYIYSNVYLSYRISNINKYLEGNVSVVGRVVDIKEKEYYVEHIIDKVYIEKERIYNTKMKVIATEKYELGDLILLDGEIELPTGARNMGGFDYRKAMQSENIFAIVNVEKSAKILSKNNLNILYNTSIFLRNQINRIIDGILKPPESDIVKGILIGDIDNLDSEVYEEYKTAGMIHLLAVSGGNIAFLSLLCIWVLKKARLNKTCINIIMIFVIILYIYITGMTSSVMRAGIMAITIFLSYLVNRKSDTITVIAFSALILLIYNPLMVWSLGFQLSFLGTIGIVVLYSRIKEYLSKYLPNKLSELIGVSLAAQLTVGPVLAYNFNSISFISIFSNIIAVPLSGVILIYGLVLVVIGAISMTVGQMCVGGLYILTKAIIWIAKISTKVAYGNIIVITPNFFEIILYYLIILYILRFLKQSKKIKMLIGIIMLVVIIMIVIPRSFSIDFIDVGHGDSILITNRYKAILIDTGGSYLSSGVKHDMAESTVVPFILDKRIKKIDLLILSHLDEDHCGGVETLVNMLKVNTIAIGDTKHDKKKLDELIKISKKEGADLIKLKASVRIRVDDIGMTVINPFGDSIDENNDSLAVMMEYKKKRILFTGDMEEEAEERLLDKGINLKADILKVGHHGSKTSTSKEFLESVLPSYAIISVGTRFKSIPSKEVIDNLEEIRVKVCRTDMEGGISVNIDDKNVYVTSCID